MHAAALEPTLLDKRGTTDPVICGEVRHRRIDPDTGELIDVIWFCRSPTCPICGEIKRDRHSRHLLQYLGDRPCRHLILTLQRMPGPLAPRLSLLLKSFKTIKRRARWRREVVGGVRFLHVEYDHENMVWGPHLHCVVETITSSIREIGLMWQEITGGSWDVWLGETAQGVHKCKVVNYAATYAFRAVEEDAELLAEFKWAIKGKRTAQPFGKPYGILRLSSKQKNPAKGNNVLSTMTCATKTERP